METLRELVQHRALVVSLVERQLSARYRGSVLGFLWTFLNPLLLMLVYSLVFSIFVRDDSIPHYASFMFCGLVPWLWFSQSLLEGSTAVLGGGTLITKALFPPQILPTVVTAANAVNFLFTLVLLFPFLMVGDRPIGHALLALPVVGCIQLLFTYGLVLAISALNVHYRDIQHIVGNVLQLWFFLCPILFSVDTASARDPRLGWVIYKLNPMGILIEAYHDIFYWNRWPHWDHLAIVAVLGVVSLALGIRVFDSYRDSFAEEL